MAAAPVNSWAAQRASLPQWLRERRQTEYRRDRRAFAAGAATGGVVAVLGVVAAAMVLMLAPTRHPVQTPNLVGPAQGDAAGPVHSSPAATPSATASSSSPSPSAASGSPSPSSSVPFSPTPTASGTVSPTATAPASP